MIDLTEQLAYEKAKKIDQSIGPIEWMFFFPTKEDVQLARKLRRYKHSKNIDNLLWAITKREGMLAEKLSLFRKYAAAFRPLLVAATPPPKTTGRGIDVSNLDPETAKIVLDTEIRKK